MIQKAFEINKINLKKYNLYLFYGENEGYKNEIIKDKFEKIYKNQIYRYEEKEILDKKNEFYNSFSPSVIKGGLDEEKLMSDDTEVPVLGKIAAGTPVEAIQNEVARVPLPENIEKKGEFFNSILTKSFFENEKLIIILRVSDKIIDIIEEISSKNIDDIKIILSANILEKKSKLRNFFEKGKNTICTAFYADNVQT